MGREESTQSIDWCAGRRRLRARVRVRVGGRGERAAYGWATESDITCLPFPNFPTPRGREPHAPRAHTHTYIYIHAVELVNEARGNARLGEVRPFNTIRRPTVWAPTGVLAKSRGEA